MPHFESLLIVLPMLRVKRLADPGDAILAKSRLVKEVIQLRLEKHEMVRLFGKLAEEFEDLFAAALFLILDVEPDEGCLDKWHNISQLHLTIFLDSIDVLSDVVIRVHELRDLFFVFLQLLEVAHIQVCKQFFDLLLGSPQLLLVIEIITLTLLGTVKLFQCGRALHVARVRVIVKCGSQRLL